VALRPVAYVHERDELRADDRAYPEAADHVQIVQRGIVDVPEHLARFDERRQLELALHAEELSLVDARPELGGEERAVEIGEPVAAEAAERAPAAEAVHHPEGRVGAALEVVDEGAHGEDGIPELAAERDEVAPLEAERDERRAAADVPV